MAKFFIVGSNSFSGSNYISRLLEENNEVIGISRSDLLPKVFWPKNINNFEKFNFYKIDINTNKKDLSELIAISKPDYIVNFASQSMVGQSWDNPIDWFETNVIGTINLIEISRKLKKLKLFIHISTPEVYGSITDRVLEDHKFNPTTPYAISRSTADMYLKSLGEIKNFPYVITRAANVYGPGQTLYRLIPKAILRFYNDEKFQLEGKGDSERSFIHISDVVDGLFRIVEKNQYNQTFHFSTDKLHSIKSILEIIGDNMGIDLSKRIETVSDRPGKDQIYHLDSTKSQELLNWHPKINLETGIKKTINWIEENINILTNHSDNYSHKK